MDIKDDEIWFETSQNSEFLSADNVYNITAQKTEDDMTVIELNLITKFLRECHIYGGHRLHC